MSSDTRAIAPVDRRASAAWPIATGPALLLDLASGDLLGVTQDGAVLRVRVAHAEDGAYSTAAGERISVRQGTVEGLRTVPQVPEHYKPSP